MLKVFVQYAQDEEEKNALKKLASDDPDQQECYEKEIVTNVRTVIEVLKEYKSVKVPLDHFLEVLPRLQPRYYSISSSPSVHTSSVHLTAVLVDYVTPLRRRVGGVTTGWFTAKKAAVKKPGLRPQCIRKFLLSSGNPTSVFRLL